MWVDCPGLPPIAKVPMFTYRYYRSDQVAKRWRDGGVDKPAGWVTGRIRFDRNEAAQQFCDYLAKQGIAAEPVTLGRSN